MSIESARHQTIAVVSTALGAAAVALAGVTLAVAGTAPAPQPDNGAIQAAIERAESAESALAQTQTELAQARQDARYTVCMYTLAPRAGDRPQDAVAVCSRNVQDYAYLTVGSEWDAREYN